MGGRSVLIAVNDVAFVPGTAFEFGVVEVLRLLGVLSTIGVDLFGWGQHLVEVGLFVGLCHGVEVPQGAGRESGVWRILTRCLAPGGGGMSVGTSTSR